MTLLEMVLSKLEGVTRPNAKGWYEAFCPAHDDRRRSLGVKAGDTGAVVLKCQAGCTTEAVVAALGLTMQDLFPTSNGRGPHRRIVATYDYCDQNDALLFQVVRFDSKEFRQRRPRRADDVPSALRQHGIWVNDTYVWSLERVEPVPGTHCPQCQGEHRAVPAVVRVLYNLRALRAADPVQPVFTTEGEKDANALTALGLLATTNAGGAGKWREEYTETLRGRHVVILPDNDVPGRDHAQRVAQSLAAVAASVRILDLPGLPPKGDVSDWIAGGGTREQLEALVTASPAGTGAHPTGEECGPWALAVTAAQFLAGDDPTLDWLIPRVLAPGSLSNLFSPRGLGKTHVAYAYAVALARSGHAVLLLDRDNSKREIRRRLRAWGAAELTTLKVLTRDEVPPLTDTAAWATFPWRAYALVIVDSLDASTEGIGEQDSSKSAKAIAPLLDIAHRADGPAILVLGNTIKSGSHGRGSGVLEDRGDIVYEVRDATNFQPTGTKPWWTELPPAGRDAWAERATRRQKRDRYVLAFVPSKFRVGIEPEPFALEIDLSAEPWQLHEVTAEVAKAGVTASAVTAAEKGDRERAAIERLATEVARRAATREDPLNLDGALAVLRQDRLPRDAARELLDREDGRQWRLVRDTARHGHPTLVLGLNEQWPPEKDEAPGSPVNRELFDSPLSPAQGAQGPEKDGLPQTSGREQAASSHPSPAGTSETLRAGSGTDPDGDPGGTDEEWLS